MLGSARFYVCQLGLRRLIDRMTISSLGSSGINVSLISLGLGFRGQRDVNTMVSVVQQALDHGVTFFDCSNRYGKTVDSPYGGMAEVALGRSISGCRDEVVITSKVGMNVGAGPNDFGGSRLHIMREVDRSLQRLATDHIDIYLVHCRDVETALEETVASMIDVVRQGKARAWGVANFTAWEACKALCIADRLGGPRPSVVQSPYNLLCRDVERELLSFCRVENLGLMTYGPLAIGLLSGFYRPFTPPPKGSVMAESARRLYEQSFRGQAIEVLSEVERIGEQRECAPSQVALNWVLSHSEVSSAIVGCDVPEQVDVNMAAAEWCLTASERDDLDTVSHSASLSVY